ncbi:DUF3238 domain-containing protein [Paenibacillus sp. ACRRX]|uniref:DUF3238 domain-containing protein n=1 Tax=unclassified Paenibacillus TaxID=185978 RepID=UPI001EF5F4D1|nr:MULTISPECIES: DUF3238 domain-containing protein [unclassified Paenibacillus]MCG7408570.1 DUF3238 domain-containing protein [Paenibacillus sp. ACRRX]MDK8182818.1 DUF3238 domain-containing protein [Paenibacillus sp. UMB4589-SE434]
MANIVVLRVAAFIPQDWILFWSTSAVDVYYNGNNREFTYYTENQPSLSKMVQHIVVDFKNKVITPYKSVGPTTEKTVSKKGEATRYAHKQAGDEGLTFSQKSISSSSASFSIRASTGNPLFTDAPNIDWKYDVTVKSDGTVTVVGEHDGYPAHEIYKRVDNGTPVKIYTHDPRKTGDTPLSLGGDMEYKVDKTV